MPSKYHLILETAKQTAKELSSKPHLYPDFLRSAANNYKYRFKDQLLIYAQKPSATACADVETWNKLGRYVNKGTKGIALLVDRDVPYKLRHVFDISNTNSFHGYEVKIWKMSEKHEEAVIDALENSFGEIEKRSTFDWAVTSVVETVVQDNYTDYLEQLSSVCAGSYLEELDADNLRKEIRNLLIDSVAFQVLERCGYDAERLFDPDDFNTISDFNTPDTMNVLGCATSDISEMILREIEETVRSAEREESKKRTFAENKTTEYDKGENFNAERSNENEPDLQERGRLSTPESQTSREPEDWQIWNVATHISSRAQKNRVQRSSTKRETEQPLGGSRPESKRDDGDADKQDETAAEHHRETQSGEPNALGEQDEQHQELSGGSSPSGTRLQLSGHDFNARSDIDYYYAPDEKNELLRNCIALKDHRKEIATFFESQEDNKERGSFIKSFFDNTYVEHILDNGDRVGYRAYDDLLTIWHGSYDTRDKEDFLYWWRVASAIEGQILLDTWLSPDEKDLISEEGQIKFIESKAELTKNEFLLPQEAIDYSILNLEGDVIELFDSEFPLLHKEIPKDEFYKCVSENPMNDKFLQIIENDSEKGEETPDIRMRISLDRGDRLVHWIYFNPDSDAGGQYVSGDLSFKVFEELIEEYDIANLPENTEKFVADFEEMSDQFLADISTPFFMEAQNDYDSEYDYLELTPENILKIHEDILSFETDRQAERTINEHEAEFGADGTRVFRETEKLSVYDRETEILYDILLALKIDDISLEYDADGNIVATDKDNRWVGRNVYDFIVEDAFAYDENEKPLGIPDDLLSDFKALADKYGVEIRDYDKPTPWDEYEQIKKENPNAIVIYQMGDFFELFGEHDTKVASEVLGLMITKKTFENKSISTPMCGFPVHVMEEYTVKLLNAGYDVVAATHEDGKLQVRKIVPSAKIQEALPLEESVTETPVQTDEPLSPPPAPKKHEKVRPNILYPEIKSEYRTNFKIENDDIGVGTPLDRFYHNIRAIELLNKLEEEHRLADTNEQRVLADYVGWGGLPEFFEETNPHYNELKELLSEDEYASARESSLTAFYTPPVVIKAIYKTLENMNFKTGNVLEPSCGIGNFMGLVPASMSDAKFYGIELDKTSGRIAQQLYQKNSIAVQGFEDTKLPDSFFDAAIGNVPFGQFKVPDKRYDKYNFLIHDYFFARTLDKVRPGGIVAFITSKGTMDKENPSVRKYIAQRADLLGAIRLPNNTFKDAAGTEVTSDIIFLQKRDRLIDIEPDWVHLNTDENGIKMNQYFVDNPDMIMGEMKLISSAHGPTPACIAYEDGDLAEQLSSAIENIHAQVTEYEFDDLVDEEEDNSIPADPDVRNFSYTVIDGKIYYRENSRMNPVDVSVTAENRIKGMIGIRDCVRTLIEYQTEDYPDVTIKEQQEKLNTLYDAFGKKYGLINSRANSSAFNQDSSYCLLSSLEILDDEGNFVRKADMFTKRTIKQKVVVTAVDTASEALALSLAEKTKIDIEYMSNLTGKSEQEIADDLKGVIFLNPKHIEDSTNPKYLPADEYLSGNIREKLREAEEYANLNDDFKPNVEALTAVMPEDLSASEISVRLGATWLPPEDVENFMFELFGTARYMAWNIHVHYSEYTGEWNIEGKSYDRNNVKAYNTYGTARINGYKIIEETLNLRDVRIFDYVEDDNGKRTQVLNKKETAIAQGKQQLIKEAFSEWIWKDPERRERLTKLYNEKFNSNRPREYDGNHLNFVGINPEISLRPHQVNAIAHIMYGGNTLLAHVVGAGKTFEMVAAAQESKRLGLCQKSLFVVPNHLTEQWASEYLQLYPSANILVATKKDFETKNRKKFCGRIATGDYDAIIIGHSQFEKIPMSLERQRAILENQLNEIMDGIAEMKRNRGDRFSIKQLEKTKKSISQKLDKLNDQSRKDDVVTFEELGVDRLFVDEAHYYKNLAAFTKMRNVGGISQTEAMKSSDLYMKCRYLDELTGGKGVVFATGTPISNSMVELYTMQKYLQYSLLRRNNLIHFDAWASTFGETVTAIELAPEGSGYRAKTRFAKFYNLPELMSLFKETADIQTADMLKLPVPKANYHNIALKPSEQQKEMVSALSERAEKVRNKMVNSSEDNMLLITNDGRKLALDQRMINPLLPDSETSKVSACADNVFEIWERTAGERSTQMVFCDLSTPHGDGTFNIYDDLRDKLIAKGVPREEIAYIHSANTEAAKKELFGKVRSGQVRVIIGSTQKMGAGTNVQKKLIALHHLDCPWRPSDLQQREGRIIRQGNENPEVEVYTYVTENTFDSYLYQLVESKQKFIGQIMTSKSPVRSAEDVDEQALSYAEIKALCTGNPYIKEKMDLDIDVARLKLLKANHLSQKYSLEDQILKTFPKQISSLEERIEGYISDIETVKANPAGDKDHFCGMTINGKYYSEKKEAGEAIIAACKAMRSPDAVPLGSYRGFEMELCFEPTSKEYRITMKKSLRHTTPLGTDIFGNIQRLDNLLEAMPDKLNACKEQLSNTKQQLENAKIEVEKPFPHEEELKTKNERLAELNSLLNMDKKDNEIVDGEREDGEERDEPERSDDRDER